VHDTRYDYKYGRMRETRVERASGGVEGLPACRERSMNPKNKLRDCENRHIYDRMKKDARHVSGVDIMRLCWKSHLIGYINVHYRNTN